MNEAVCAAVVSRPNYETERIKNDSVKKISPTRQRVYFYPRTDRFAAGVNFNKLTMSRRSREIRRKITKICSRVVVDTCR